MKSFWFKLQNGTSSAEIFSDLIDSFNLSEGVSRSSLELLL
jgi:hypothetical protein